MPELTFNIKCNILINYCNYTNVYFQKFRHFNFWIYYFGGKFNGALESQYSPLEFTHLWTYKLISISLTSEMHYKFRIWCNYPRLTITSGCIIIPGGGTAGGAVYDKIISCTAAGMCALCASVNVIRWSLRGSFNSGQIVKASRSWGGGSCIRTAKLCGLVRWQHFTKPSHTTFWFHT